MKQPSRTRQKCEQNMTPTDEIGMATMRLRFQNQIIRADEVNNGTFYLYDYKGRVNICQVEGDKVYIVNGISTLFDDSQLMAIPFIQAWLIFREKHMEKMEQRGQPLSRDFYYLILMEVLACGTADEEDENESDRTVYRQVCPKCSAYICGYNDGNWQKIQNQWTLVHECGEDIAGSMGGIENPKKFAQYDPEHIYVIATDQIDDLNKVLRFCTTKELADMYKSLFGISIPAKESIIRKEDLRQHTIGNRILDILSKASETMADKDDNEVMIGKTITKKMVIEALGSMEEINTNYIANKFNVSLQCAETILSSLEEKGDIYRSRFYPYLRLAKIYYCDKHGKMSGGDVLWISKCGIDIPSCPECKRELAKIR